MKSFKVRNYALEKDGIYFAASITLNLTATGNTLTEAKNNLNKLVHDYLRTITKNRELKDIEHLLNRPAPLYMYIDYIICSIYHCLSKANKPCTFEERIPYNIQFAR